MDFVEEIIDKLSRQMMLDNGYNETDNPTEWDLDIKDSQHSIVREMVGFVVTNTIEAIQCLQPEDGESDEASEETSEQDIDEAVRIEIDRYGKRLMEMQDGAVRQHANFFIFLDAGAGNPHYVSDVRKFLDAVDRLGIPDDTEIEGSLYLNFDYDSTQIEKIECGECGQDDVIVTAHKCDGRWLERYRKSKEQQET
jgi:hypothetical protein